MLAGIGSLTIVDHEIVTPADLGSQFFIGETDLGMNRATAAAPQIGRLNPRVKIIVDTEAPMTKPPSYFDAFDIVIATDLLPQIFNYLNVATRLNHKPFYAAGVHGFYGFIFSDLIQHDYVIEREKGNRETLLQPETRTRSIIDVKTKKENGKNIEMVTKRETYSTWFLASDVALLPTDYTKSRRRLKAVTPLLSCFRALWSFVESSGGFPPSHNRADLESFTKLATQKHRALGLPEETLRAEFLRSFMQNVGSEIAPVTAVLGGQLAQDVINVLGQRQQPIQNMVLFDGEANEAPMYALHPEGALGEDLLPISNTAMELNGTMGPIDNGGVFVDGPLVT